MQFWYTDDTAMKVAAEVVRAAGSGRIACLACPSLFRKLEQSHPEAQTHLFEYDTRFAVGYSFKAYSLPFYAQQGRKD